MEAALRDRVPAGNVDSTVVVCMVLGAGRGPLVDRLLRAGRATGRNLRVYALDKNGAAMPGLVLRNQREWEGKVGVELAYFSPLGSCRLYRLRQKK